MFKPRDMWGSYKIVNDSIFIEYFYDNGTNQTGLMNRNSIELHGIITDSNGFKLSKKICAWCSEVYGFNRNQGEETVIEFVPDAKYKLFKSEYKLDSTNAWFVNRNWYKKNLHPSRK